MAIKGLPIIELLKFQEISSSLSTEKELGLIVHMYQFSSEDGPIADAGVISVAARQITATGLKGLTLRSLAQETGISASLLTYRYGTRDALIGRILDDAAERNASDWALLDERLRGIAVDHGGLHALAIAVALHRITQGRECSLLGWISHTAAQRNGETRSAAGDRPPARSRFWINRFQEAGIDPALAHAFSAGMEGMIRIGLIAPMDPRFAVWMSDGVTRLCDRITGCPPSRAGDSSARARIEASDHSALKSGEGTGRSETPDRIIDAAVALILSAGPDALTHRLIAKEAGVSLSSMTHHFATLDDIMLRAFDRIYEQASIEAASGLGETHTIATLCHEVLPSIFARARVRGQEGIAMDEIMLFTSRKPALAPMAGGLLAMTGRTSTTLLQAVATIGERADRLDGQIFRFVLTGLSEDAARLPAEERDAWMAGQCEAYLRACWPEG